MGRRITALSAVREGEWREVRGLRGQFPRRFAMSGTAIKTKRGIMRMEARLAYRPTSSRIKSRGRGGLRVVLKATNVARIITR